MMMRAAMHCRLVSMIMTTKNCSSTRQEVNHLFSSFRAPWTLICPKSAKPEISKPLNMETYHSTAGESGEVAVNPAVRLNEAKTIVVVGAFFGAFFVTSLCCWFFLWLFKESICAHRCPRRESEANRRRASSSSRGRRRSGHRYASFEERSTINQPPYALTSVSPQGTLSNSFLESSTPSFYPHSESSSTRAPSRPSRASRRTEDHEVEVLLRALPKLRCSRNDKRMCSICLDSLSNASATMGSCCHPVHIRCLKCWLETSRYRSCPVCRTRLVISGGTWNDWIVVFSPVF